MIDSPLISIAAPSEPEEKIAFQSAPSTSTITLDPKLSQDRAFKASYGLEGTSAAKPQPEIEQALNDGQEDSARTEAATTLNAEAEQKKSDAIVAAISSKQSPLTVQDMADIYGKTGYTTYDPMSVFEKKYADSYVGELDKFAAKVTDSNFWNTAQREMPTDLAITRAGGSVPIAQHEFFLTRAQNLQKKIEQMPAIGAGVYGQDNIPGMVGSMGLPIPSDDRPGRITQLAKTFLPGYHELNMRAGGVDTTGFFDGFLGANLTQQRRDLLKLPYNEMVPKANKIIDRLEQENPYEALAFTMSMMGQSSADYLFNQINTAADLSTIPGIKLTSAIVRRLRAASQVRQALRDVVQSSISPEVTKANILGAVGDLPGAAVETMAGRIIQTIQGTRQPTVDALEMLPRHMQMDIQNIRMNPGSLSQAQLAMLEEQYAVREDKFLTTLSLTAKPDRLSKELIQQNLEPIKQVVKDTYPELPFVYISDPVHEPVANVYNVTGWVGNRGGEAFMTEWDAIQTARNKGIPVYLNPDQTAYVDQRIKDLRAEVRAGPDMDADAAGLTLHYANEKALKDLEQLRAEAPKSSVGAGKILGTPKEDSSNLIGHNGGPPMASTVQEGLGFYIEVTKPLDETSKVIRDLLVTPDRPASQAPGRWTNSLFDYVRTAEDTVSPEQRANRKAAVYSQANLYAVMDEEVKYIKDVINGTIRQDPVTGFNIPWRKQNDATKRALWRDKEGKRFEEVLEYGQKAHDPVTGEPGYTFPNQTELEAHYLQVYGELPTFTETQAYWAMKRFNEMDAMLRDVGEFRYRHRLGAETHTITTTDAAGNQIKIPPFDGMRQPEWPTGNYAVLILGENGKHKVENLSRINTNKTLKKQYTEAVQEGKSKVIEVYDVDSRPFSSLDVKNSDARIRYVLADNIETAPLSWQKMNRRGGGHFIYEYENYLKQASMREETIGGTTRYHYEGDRTIFPLSNRAMGKDLEEKMNTVASLLKTNQDEAAKQFAVENLRVVPWEELVRNFRGATVDGKHIPPIWNINEPFRVVPKGASIRGMSNELIERYGDHAFNDATRSGSAARAFQIEFSGPRDSDQLYTPVNRGSVANPDYQLQLAERLNPISSMNRALNRVINSTFMDDYKISAVEAWVRKAAPHLDVKSISEVESSPFAWFKKPEWRKDTDFNIKTELMAERFKIDQLVGVPSSKYDAMMHSIAQNLADSLYVYGGPKAFNKIGELTPSWLMPTIKDPTAFLRSATFHNFLGLFNIPQLVIQQASWATIWSLSPKYAASSTAAVWLHQLSRINKAPEIIAGLDKMVQNLRLPGMAKWRPGEWTEAMETLDRSGFGKVAGEFAPQDMLRSQKVITNGKDTFLNAGLVPFKESERHVRLGAWYTAFKEYRDTHPTGPLGQPEINAIRDKADLYYGNMSSASNSALHTGIVSLPTQFFTYNIRLAELAASSRITHMQRARLLAVYGALYGVSGIGVTGFPGGEWVREQAMAGNIPGSLGLGDNVIGNAVKSALPQMDPYIPGQHLATTLIMEGIPATLVSAITAGYENGFDPAKGKFVNIGPRMGPGGLTQVGEAVWGDAGFWTILGGASTSMVSNFGKSLDGFTNVALSAVRADNKYFQPKVEDFLDPLRAMSATVDKGARLWIALNTMQWVDKSAGYITDVKPLEAVLMTLTGTSPTEQVDLRLARLSTKQLHEQYKKAEKYFIEEWRRGILAEAAGDTNQRQDYLNRAFAILEINKIPLEMRGKFMAAANKGYESQISQGKWDYYVKNAPVGDEDKRMKAYQYDQKNKGQ